MKQIPSCQIGIKDIYASNFLHTVLWSFVSGQRLCGVDFGVSIRNFIEHFGLEDVEEGTLRQAFYRKDAEYKKASSGICSDAKNVFKPDEIDRALGLVKKIITHGES